MTTIVDSILFWATRAVAAGLVVSAAAWVGCKLRVLPVPLMRAWFCAVFFTNLIAMRVISFWLDALQRVGLSSAQTACLVSYMCHYMFWAQTQLCPHITVQAADAQSWQVFDGIPPRSFICLNHTSFYDAFVFVGFSPTHVITNCRTMVKESLRRVPIFGPVYDRIGHFPVYFKSGESFSVDAEKQKEVQVRVDKFVNEQRGNLSVFPEGQLNKTPAQLQPFRYGSIKFAIENKMPVYFFALWGAHTTWPIDAAVGGLPADIRYIVRKFDIDYASAKELDTAVLAATMQAEMQRLVDQLAAADAKKQN